MAQIDSWVHSEIKAAHRKEQNSRMSWSLVKDQKIICFGEEVTAQQVKKSLM